MSDKTNKNFWDRFAKLYGPFMKKDKKFMTKFPKTLFPTWIKTWMSLNLLMGRGKCPLAFLSIVNLGLEQTFPSK